MFREYRDVSLNGAIDMMYNDMAGRHRTRFESIQIIRTATLKDEDCKRPTTLQYHVRLLIPDEVETLITLSFLHRTLTLNTLFLIVY